MAAAAPTPAPGVRGVHVANILPAGATRSRQKPELSPAPPPSPPDSPPPADECGDAFTLPEFREYPFPPPGHPVAYPAT
jgi:hypothetical protein